jgi:hypothetical protein
MINIKNIFRREQKFDDTIASIWFGAAVPFGMAIAVTVSWAASWLDVRLLDWLFLPIGGAVFVVLAAGGWIFPLIGAILAARGFKSNRNVALASLVLSTSELLFYIVVMGSIFLNSNTLVD